jgi:acyl-[acyl-carrier-protein]-phospholipid O-acyltransferase/long-chain-fatty-acid--[acyl-carrier-protein] ligase
MLPVKNNQLPVIILLGTATFFRLYLRNRKLQPLMLASIRLVVAGAEKLPNKILDDFKQN